MQQQLTQVRDTTQGATTVWLASPVLKEYEQYLQQLLNAPPLQPLETGMQMMRTADTLWPESLQQQEASRMWSNTLRNRAQASPQMKGWQQARQNLRDFADLMMKKETEKQGFTLSYIKTVTWQAERLLNQETPLEYSADAVPGDPYTEAGHTGVGKRDQRTAGRAVKPLAAAEKYRTGYGNG